MGDLDNPLWNFSLAIYSAPGVSDQCIKLQDNDGIDVNILLFVAWLGASKRRKICHQDLVRFDNATTFWRHELIVPIRTIRRRMKSLDANVYCCLKDIELRLEQVEQRQLYLIGTEFPVLEKHSSAKLAETNIRFYLAHMNADVTSADLLISSVTQHIRRH